MKKLVIISLALGLVSYIYAGCGACGSSVKKACSSESVSAEASCSKDNKSSDKDNKSCSSVKSSCWKKASCSE